MSNHNPRRKNKNKRVQKNPQLNGRTRYCRCHGLEIVSGNHTHKHRRKAFPDIWAIVEKNAKAWDALSDWRKQASIYNHVPGKIEE